MRETSGMKTHMEGSASFLDVGDEDARAGRLVAALDDHDAQTLHPVVNITTFVIAIMFLFVITSLPLCTLNSRLALNFLNSSDSKICKTFSSGMMLLMIMLLVMMVITWMVTMLLLMMAKIWIIGDDGSEVDGHVIDEERMMMRISLRTKTMMCLTM